MVNVNPDYVVNNPSLVPTVPIPETSTEPQSLGDFDGAVSVQYSELASKQLHADMYVVTRGFTYTHTLNGVKSTVYVPVGFTTDLASIPRLFWWFLPPEGQYGQAAILHDYLCEYMQVMVSGVATHIPRTEVDATLNQAMIDLGVPAFRRRCIYSAVSLYRLLFGVKKATFSQAKFDMETQMRATFEATGQFP